MNSPHRQVIFIFPFFILEVILMKIKTAEFIISAAALHQVPASKLPEVAFIGRSNVGKSSLINSLCHRRSLAKTSSQPGKTRVINFYRINGALHFVDLPGYGYAKVPDQIRSGWRHLIEGYLKKRDNLKLGLVVVDARHEMSKLDAAMVEWLEFYAIPYSLVMTKADKVPRQKLTNHINEVSSNMLHENKYCRAILPYSSVSGEGKQELLSLIQSSTDL
jgi:GTP-binding protein